jgi:rod shape-determining protein MreD
MRILTHIAAAFLLLVLLGGLWRIMPFDVITPDLALLVALYLGASVRGHVWEATAAALVIGYLGDVLAVAPRGLGAFVLGAICLLARLATARLLVRGTIFTAVFCLIGALAASALAFIVRASFGELGPIDRELPAAFGSVLLTAALGPAVFRVCRWIDARFARTARERQALREGYLS